MSKRPKPPYFCNRCRVTHMVRPSCVCCQRWLHWTEHGQLLCNDCRETTEAADDAAYAEAWAHQNDEENPF